MALAVGDTVRGRYTLAEQLGTGGFSTVWRAHDAERDGDVALKLPAFDSHDRETVFERFERERRLLAPFADGLSHGTLVRYLDSSLEAPPRYLAFELLTGETLSAAFGTEALGSGVRRRIATDLAETLDFLHRNDVLYLDLKPENVVLRPSGRPALLDFNTAVRAGTQVETVFEADQYKPPELRPGGDATVGPWSDVYSWGKLAFYLLTGVRVPTANVPAGGLDARSFGSDCPRPLADVVQEATRLDPGERYEDGPTLASAVARATVRGPRLLLTHPSGVACAVADGDTLGRLVVDESVPWVVLADPDAHVSANHARFERSTDGWRLLDTSHNGTYVTDGNGWSFVLSEAGYRRRRDAGEFDTDQPQPSTVVPVADGTVLAPVHPKYGIQLRVTAI